MNRARSRYIACLLLSCLVLGAAVFGQSPAGAPAATPPEKEDQATVSFRSYSRMVLVDVIVKDSNGVPVHGLKASDFEVMEDGVPQRVISFSEMDENRPRFATRYAAHSADVFTNTAPQQEEVRPSIILLDLLNTAPADRPIARRALLRFLRERMQRSEPLAIFVLWNRLELIQDFSGDRALLQTAIDHDRRTLADPKKETMNSDMMARVADLYTEDPLAAEVFQRMVENMERIEDNFETERTVARADATLAAMRGIARFAEKYPGRKALVWMSAAFPFAIDTEFGRLDFDLQLRQTTNQLTAAQVAVYPVDVRGLTPVESKPFTEDLSRKWLTNPDQKFTPAFQAAYHGLFDSQDTMKEIADLTGGIAYINRNDLHVAIASALEDNRDAYTLGYYPVKKDFNNRFRRIKVRLNGREATLRYRRGYYAAGFSVEKRPSTELLTALESDATVSAQIPLVSRLQPSPPVANTPFKIELFVQGGNVSYNGGTSRGAAFLDFAVIALGPNGRTVARTWHRGELRLDAAKQAKAEKSGLIYSLPINLPAGQYKIRAGVRDSFTGRIGTIEIPVVVK